MAISAAALVLAAPRVLLAQTGPSGESQAAAPAEPSEAGEGVVVRGVRNDAPARTFSGEEARNTPGALGDPFRIIESLPGVAPVMWPAAIYSVRGSNPGETGFFIDGLRVPSLFHFALGPSVVHPYLIDGVDFYPGVYPARYGGYSAGIVSARSLPPPNDRARASVDVRLYDAGGMVSTPVDEGRGTLLLAGRYSYTGPILSLFSDTNLGYADYQLRFDHRLGAGQATVFALGSFDDLSSDTDPNLDAVQQFHRVDLRWAGRLGRGRLETALAFGYDRTRSHLFDVPFEVRSVSVAPRLAYRLALGEFGLLEFGNDITFARFEPEPGPFQGRLNDLANTRSAWSNGVFASLTLHAGERLILTPAFRVEEFVEGGGVAVEPLPRLFVRFRAADPLWLKASVGRTAQMPSVPVGVAGMESFGLADYGPQTSLGGTLGFEADVASWFNLDVTAFANKMRVTDIRSTSQLFNVLRENYFEARSARSYGVELMLERRREHALSGFVTYTLSKSERQVDYIYGPSDWDQRHVLNLVANQRLGRNWSVGARFHYHSGRIVSVEGDWSWQSLALNVERRRLPAFYQVDLRVEKKWVMDSLVLFLYAECANVTATPEVYGYRNETVLDHETLMERTEFTEQAFRIVLPSLGLRAEL